MLLHRWFALSWRQRGLLLEAWLLLGLARGFVRFVPFRHYSKFLGKPLPCTTSITEQAVDHQEIATIIREISRAARYTPWESSCLPQAMTGKWMLARRSIATTLHLGLRKDATQAWQAHAWLTANQRLLLGGRRSHGFKRIAMFR